jgi:hypothetical protein
LLGERGARVTVPAGELGDLRLLGAGDQQLRAEHGHRVQDLRQRPVLGEQIIDVRRI